jgi:UDP-N-acetylglucosamine diphosphorylase / glucose-1-phosphate thymidylyltransferase / UDP-N-acetylgalactosamine diphosphorylase / glucosamine-1-phosphate N-acetyltransferase / galactosamine-1-phosphate N-acetyltransferase
MINNFFPSNRDIQKLFPFIVIKNHINGSGVSSESEIHESVIIGKNVSIGKNTIIMPYVVIEDDVIIGNECIIRSGALIRSTTFIGNQVVIGHATEMKHAYLDNEVKVGSHCFVGNSLLGKGARIGSGTITGNRRFDQKEIHWNGPNGKVETKLDKLGLVLGEYARLGANCTTNPGTMIGANTWVSGGQIVSGFIDANKFIKQSGEVVENAHKQELSIKDNSGVV